MEESSVKSVRQLWNDMQLSKWRFFWCTLQLFFNWISRSICLISWLVLATFLWMFLSVPVSFPLKLFSERDIDHSGVFPPALFRINKVPQVQAPPRDPYTKPSIMLSGPTCLATARAASASEPPPWAQSPHCVPAGLPAGLFSHPMT